MNPDQFIATLRKLGNYLAGLFPTLAIIAGFFGAKAANLLSRLLETAFMKRIVTSAIFQPLWKVVERFYWRNYAKERLDFDKAAPEFVAALRPILQLCVILCILIPLTQYSLSPVTIERFSGVSGTAPAWSLLLMTIGYPLAWASLLTGAAVSNRPATLFLLLFGLYFMSTCVILMPRHFLNVTLSLAILSTLFFSECVLSRETRISRFLSWLNCLAVGAAAGVSLVALTPLKPLLDRVFGLSGYGSSIICGGLIGIVIGIIIRKSSISTLSNGDRIVGFIQEKGNLRLLERFCTMGGFTWFLSALVLIFVLSAVLRGGLAQSGGLMLSSLDQSNSYLWPVWYFIGLGIAHKLMSTSKVVANSITSLIPTKVLSPIVLLASIFMALLFFSSDIILFLSNQTGPIMEKSMHFFMPVYQLGKSLFWQNGVNSLAGKWYSWVSLALAIVCLYLFARRRLTGSIGARLIFIAVLCWFAVWEYVFQLTSFSRSTQHSTFLLFFFASWLLWLMHVVCWKMSLESSSHWPSRGRLALYGGVAALAMLHIFGRAASQDFKLVNELFFSMFRGIIDVGLPYYLYLWAGRRFPGLSLPTGSIFSAFAWGAILSLIFNALDKFAASAWSPEAFQSLLARQLRGLTEYGDCSIELSIPWEWTIAKSFLFGFLLVVTVLVWRKRLQESSKKSDYTRELQSTFILLSFASGLVAFSRSFISLPIPQTLQIAFAPWSEELSLSCDLLVRYLAYWIPAIMVCYLLLLKKETGRAPIHSTAFVLIIAASINFSIMYGYEEFGILLRLTNMLYALVFLLSVLFCIFIALAMDMIGKQANEPDKESNFKEAILSARECIALLLFSAFALLFLQFSRGFQSPVAMKLPILEKPVYLLPGWNSQQVDPTSTAGLPTAVFSRELKNTSALGGISDTSFLQVTLLDKDDAGLSKQLEKLVEDARSKAILPDMTVRGYQSFQAFVPETIGCHFDYCIKVPAMGESLPMAGLVILSPLDKKHVLAMTILCSHLEIESGKWECLWALRKLQDPET